MSFSLVDSYYEYDPGFSLGLQILVLALPGSNSFFCGSVRLLKFVRKSWIYASAMKIIDWDWLRSVI